MDELIKKFENFVTSTEQRLVTIEGKTESEAKKAVEPLSAELKELSSRIKERNVSLPGVEDEKEKFSFAKATIAINTKDWTGADFEKKVFEDARKRSTVNGLTGAQGGYLVPIEIAKEIIGPAMANTVLDKLGITKYDGLSGDLPFPESTDRPTLTWIREGGAATASAVAFGERIMRPKTGSMLLKLSGKLMQQTSGVAEKIVREKMLEGVKLGMDRVGLYGLGNTKEPLGLFNASAIDSDEINANGARLTVDRIAQAMADIEDADYAASGLILHPRVKSGLKRERVAQFSGDTEGQPLVNPLMSDKVLADLLGLVFAATTQITKADTHGTSGASCAKTIVGNFAEFVMATWGGLQLKSSDQAGTAFETNELWLALFVDLDTMVKQAGAFKILTGCQTDETKW